MVGLRVLYLLIIINIATCSVLFEKSDQSSDQLQSCVAHILKKYFTNTPTISYVDLNSEDPHLIKILHTIGNHTVVSKRPYVASHIPDLAYLVVADTITDFLANFIYLRLERYWSPTSRFIIIILHFEKDFMNDIFDFLLRDHVNNVILIDGNKQNHVYTYNPFDNFACGKRYEKIIEYGPCLAPYVTDFYPNKLVTKLRNCTFNVITTHIPPYSINPKIKMDKHFLFGIEQFAFDVLRKVEGFEVNVIYTDFAEQFSTFDDNMTATGVLRALQTGEADAVIGGLNLNSVRSHALSYLYAHLAMFDELTFIVPRAGFVPIWQNMYMEFEPTIWALLVFSFVIYAILITCIVKTSDKLSLILKMFDSLLGHGYVIRSRGAVRNIFIVWVWYSYVINSIYQSNLVSLTTHPVRSYQVTSEEDLRKYNFEPCMSDVIIQFMLSIAGRKFENKHRHCRHTIQSIKTVSQPQHNMYTIVPLSLFLYNRDVYRGDAGSTQLYAFKKPFCKLMYAMYLYKGFPRLERLHSLTMRLRESGLMDKHFYDLYYEHTLSHDFGTAWGGPHGYMVVPWWILVAGAVLAALVLLLEILDAKYNITGMAPHKKLVTYP